MSASTFGMNEMHSQEQISLLLQNPIVQELIDILENEGSSILKELDLSTVNSFFDTLKTTKRGRPRVYEPDKKLQAFLYGLAEGKRTIRGISGCLKTTVAQLFLDLDQAISYATLNRFWHQLASVAEQVFKDLVQVVNNLGLYGSRQAAESTSIETPFEDDPDARVFLINGVLSQPFYYLYITDFSFQIQYFNQIFLRFFILLYLLMIFILPNPFL